MSEALLDCQITATYARTGNGIRDVQLRAESGEILGIAGESGSGKSTLALSLIGMAQRAGATVSGSIRFEGQELLQLRGEQLRRVRGRRIGFASQSSGSALNPALRIRTHFREFWRAHATGDGWLDAATPLLETLRIPATTAFLASYPRELSVGMAQRVVLALALLHSPSLLIADEPTSALDLVTQAELLKLLARLRAERGLSILLISHDLLALSAICDRIAILRKGELLEVVSPSELLAGGNHPYTGELARALGDLMATRCSPYESDYSVAHIR